MADANEFSFSNISRGNVTCDSEFSLAQKNILISAFGGVGGLSALFCLVALILTCYYQSSYIEDLPIGWFFIS